MKRRYNIITKKVKDVKSQEIQSLENIKMGDIISIKMEKIKKSKKSKNLPTQLLKNQCSISVSDNSYVKDFIYH